MSTHVCGTYSNVLSVVRVYTYMYVHVALHVDYNLSKKIKSCILVRLNVVNCTPAAKNSTSTWPPQIARQRFPS